MSATCPVCGKRLTTNQVRIGRIYCSRSCGAKSRGARFRGVVCQFNDCGLPPRRYGYCDRHSQRFRANGYVTPERPNEDARFAASFVAGSPDECWEWQGERHDFGYGLFSTFRDGRRTRRLAHRLSLLRSGVDIEGLVVRHRCDNPPCVNPNHLEVGTQADNVQDAIERDRLNISGLSAECVKTCRTCSAEFMGVPSSRYCDTCRAAGGTTPKDRARLMRKNRVTA